MRKTDQRGFAFFELLVITGLLVIVALAGWNIYQRSQKNETATSPSSSSSVSVLKDVPQAPDVAATSDLDKASQTLDQTQIDSDSDTVDLDKELSSF